MAHIQSLHLHIDDSIKLISISTLPVQIWRCEDWIFVVKTKIQSLHHQICTCIIDMDINQSEQLIQRCKDCIRGLLLSVQVCRASEGQPVFYNRVSMSQNQSLHLYFDNRIWLILILILPVQIWWCKDWIFMVKSKIQSLHHQICTGIIDMGTNWIPYLIWRCKNCMQGHWPLAQL